MKSIFTAPSASLVAAFLQCWPIASQGCIQALWRPAHCHSRRTLSGLRQSTVRVPSQDPPLLSCSADAWSPLLQLLYPVHEQRGGNHDQVRTPDLFPRKNAGIKLNFQQKEQAHTAEVLNSKVGQQRNGHNGFAKPHPSLEHRVASDKWSIFAARTTRAANCCALLSGCSSASMPLNCLSCRVASQCRP